MDFDKKLSKALALLEQGYSSNIVAIETGFQPDEISKLTKLHAIKTLEARFYSDCQNQLSQRMPELLHDTLNELHRIIRSPRESVKNKLYAAKIILNMATP